MVLALAAVLAVEPTSPARAASPVRGVWVAGLGLGPTSTTAGIRDLVDRAKRAGLNTLFVVVWNSGYTHYPSDVMNQEIGVAIHPQLVGRDPLQEIVDAAHAAGLEVHAWFEFGFASSYRQPDGGLLLRKRPEWAARDAAGRLVSREGFQWLNAFDPTVQDFVLGLMIEAATHYELDGVQGDDRLPALPSTGGYDPMTVKLYQDDHHGASPPNDASDQAWVEWRADRLSQFAARAYAKIKQSAPDACVSWAPSVYPWSKVQYLQDWPQWLRDGSGDLFIPQLYRNDLTEYRHELEQLARQAPPELRHKVIPGMLATLGDYVLSDDQLLEMVAANREFGFQGEVYFYHASLWRHADVLERLYGAAPSAIGDAETR